MNLQDRVKVALGSIFTRVGPSCVTLGGSVNVEVYGLLYNRLSVTHIAQ